MDGLLEVLLGLILGAIAMYWIFSYFSKMRNKETIEVQSTVLLERIKNVCKLISVEGDFTEIYKYENTRERFLSMVSSKKKALIVINAKVHIGYDLQRIRLEANNAKKKIVLSSFPQPQILSIEPQLEFYDIKNGFFNAFTPNDLTSLNQEAIKHIRDRIPQSGLMDTARKEALEAILLMEKLVETIGWKLEYSALELSAAEQEKINP